MNIKQWHEYLRSLSEEELLKMALEGNTAKEIMSAYAELVRRYWELRDFDRRKKTALERKILMIEEKYGKEIRWIR